MKSSIRIRLWLEEKGLFPKGRLAVIACYILALDVLLFAIQEIAASFHKPFGAYLGGWVAVLSLTFMVLLGILAKRWLSARMLWRMRNRLIVTYIFIGVIPLLLLVNLAGAAFYLFAGQFATYIVKSKLGAQLKSLDETNRLLANSIAANYGVKEKPAAPPTNWAQVSAWSGSELVVKNTPLPISIPAGIHAGFSGIVQDDGKFYLRSVAEVPAARGPLTVVASKPIDTRVLVDLSSDLGEITFGELRPGTGEQWLPEYSVGTIPPAQRTFDGVVALGTHVEAINWKDGSAANPAVFSVRTRLSKLSEQLFSSLGDLAPTIELILLLLAILLAVFEAIAVYIGTRLTRTVTGAVAELYRGTTFVNRGDFSHRIPIQSKDQLAALAGSFNLMTESIEKLILEQKEKQRLENEITIAQEVQNQLFPRRITQLASLEVHGFCRPARSVSGDYYDFLALGSQRMVVAVGDVSGKGISAALLMATIHSAVRAYSLEGIPAFRQMEAVGAGTVISPKYDPVVPGAEVSPATLLTLLNHQLYYSTPLEKYATLFMGIWDGDARRLTFANAGHLPPLLLGASGSLRRLSDGGTVVGLFDEVSYDEGSVQLRPGDIFLAYSDGVTEPENDFGEFGEERLIELVHQNRDLPLERISEIVTAAVDDWIGAAEQPDDVTLVLARAR
jgi:sigma-B regulation protein RsbU (phosphoserine phosphatase)